MTQPHHPGQPGHPSDAEAGIHTNADFAPFVQRNDIFSRAMWDETLRSAQTDGFFASYRIEAAPRRGEGFQHRDFALRNAAWLLADIVANRRASDGLREGFQAPIQPDTPVSPQAIAVESPADMAREIKQVARFFGAGVACHELQ